MVDSLFVIRTNVTSILVHGNAVLVKSRHSTTKRRMWDIYSFDEAVKQGFVAPR